MNLTTTNDEQNFKLLYFQVTDVWKRLCELHTSLLDLTLNEYSLLLSSEIEQLEEKLKVKQAVIDKITSIESLRAKLIQEINSYLSKKSDRSVENIRDLIELMSTLEEEKKGKHLSRFNDYLIDIIEKIQQQNKKNQIFINRAVISLRNIREEALGTLKNKTYNSKGAAVSQSLKRT